MVGIIEIGADEAFASDDKNVLNWKGQEYVKTCGEFVMDLPKGGQAFCTLSYDHPDLKHVNTHVGGYLTSFDPDVIEAEAREKGEDFFASVVFQALGAASTCWDKDGVFESEKAKEIGDRLTAWLEKWKDL